MAHREKYRRAQLGHNFLYRGGNIVFVALYALFGQLRVDNGPFVRQIKQCRTKKSGKLRQGAQIVFVKFKTELLSNRRSKVRVMREGAVDRRGRPPVEGCTPDLEDS